MSKQFYMQMGEDNPQEQKESKFQKIAKEQLRDVAKDKVEDIAVDMLMSKVQLLSAANGTAIIGMPIALVEILSAFFQELETGLKNEQGVQR